jgi:hypothetical protein
MAFNEHDVLTALDGALASGAALFSFTEEGHPLRQGLLGVLSGITTARTLVEEMPSRRRSRSPRGAAIRRT